MAIVVPTIDSFKDTTVMKSLRKVVDYIINTLVPSINTDISNVQSTANTALTTAQNAQSAAETAQDTADANSALLTQVVTQFNIMVDYLGTDSELVTGTAPQKIVTNTRNR